MSGATKFRGNKPRVRKVIFPLDGQPAWRGSVPGHLYLVGDGLHFYTWQEAIDYATDPTRWAPESRKAPQ